jgi:integrase
MLGLAMHQALSQANEEWLYPRYMKTGKCSANSASASINKWLKRDFDGLTAHCLRHTLRDRLRAVECPMDMIDQIGGWRISGNHRGRVRKGLFSGGY